ncbi:hypothetical protein DGo_CA0923 [Deinococcus gobiensis I-0]|uniref:Uncharacterized protein n=1 Tax=Deinococcus gobiensis (strain DSM 21396 / JCM 16679 / CGMCC 1.7299 / I-0) TaxID=745776 RepID=H8GYS3_DEIGI|nr:hypothetical protein DGo_CA0923 [Deinococcus gobiensis I-0]
MDRKTEPSSACQHSESGRRAAREGRAGHEGARTLPSRKAAAGFSHWKA